MQNIEKGDMVLVMDNLEDELCDIGMDPQIAEGFSQIHVGNEYEVYNVWKDGEGQKFCTVDLCVEIPIQCCELLG